MDSLSEDIREWGTSDRFPPARDQLLGWSKRVAEMERDLKRLETIAAYAVPVNGTAKRGRKVRA